MKFIKNIIEMHNGALPGVSQPVTLANVTNDRKEDMKKENNRRRREYNADAPKSFAQFFSNEEELPKDEMSDDEFDMEDDEMSEEPSDDELNDIEDDSKFDDIDDDGYDMETIPGDDEYDWDDPENPEMRAYLDMDDDEDDDDFEEEGDFDEDGDDDFSFDYEEDYDEDPDELNFDDENPVGDGESDREYAFLNDVDFDELDKDDEDDYELDNDRDNNVEYEDIEKDEEEEYYDELQIPVQLNINGQQYEFIYYPDEDYDIEETSPSDVFHRLIDEPWFAQLSKQEKNQAIRDSIEIIRNANINDENEEESIFDDRMTHTRLRQYLQFANAAEEEEDLEDGYYDDVRDKHYDSEAEYEDEMDDDNIAAGVRDSGNVDWGDDDSYYDDEGGYYDSEDDYENSIEEYPEDDEYAENEEQQTAPRFDRLIQQLTKVSQPDNCGCEENEEDIEPEEDDFDRAASALSDEEIDEIDDVTGPVSKWWREQVVKKSVSEFDEEAEETNTPHQAPKKDQARNIFQELYKQPDANRASIIEQMKQRLNLTDSSATSYYQALAKEFNFHPGDLEGDAMLAGEGDDEMNPDLMDPQEYMMGMEDEDMGDETPEVQEWDDPDRAGLIRVVDNAHLVYKRQSEDGTFEELWSFNVSDLNNELKIRRDILSGTDIPQNKTTSEDGNQRYTLTTMGNAQLLHIGGLSN